MQAENFQNNNKDKYYGDNYELLLSLKIRKKRGKEANEIESKWVPSYYRKKSTPKTYQVQ